MKLYLSEDEANLVILALQHHNCYTLDAEEVQVKVLIDKIETKLKEVKEWAQTYTNGVPDSVIDHDVGDDFK